jgi:Trk K+ transport system NAD-binding subunit/Kef-type K+ transport system membrane component KefB
LAQHTLVFYLAAFGLIALASRQVGEFLLRFKLPLISGFLFTGILAGPFLLNLVTVEEITRLRFLDQAALAFIAFAAGGELDLQVVRRSFRTIVSILMGQTILILAFGILAFMLVADLIPFTQDLSRTGVLAAGILASTILIARSPSSAYAIIKEVRSKGPFTQNVLGATVLTDAIVIILFAIAVSIADVMIEGASFNIGIFIFLLFEILLDIVLGIIIGVLLQSVMYLRSRYIKGFLILALGYGVFMLATQLHGIHLGPFPVGIFSEPLLICMIAGFYLANFTRYKTEFHKAIEDLAPGVFIVFFTLVGAELKLDVINRAWIVILVLSFARLVGMALGGLFGGMNSRQPAKHNLLMGFALLTQAGVSVGLANEVGVEFQPWGNEMATIIIGVIVINQIAGPPALKWVLSLVGEAHPRADPPAFDGVRDAYIFGLESQSIALARQLKAHDWEAVVVTRNPKRLNGVENQNFDMLTVHDHSLQTLRNIELQKADTVILMVTDEENYKLCEKIYENFGIRNVIVRLHNRGNAEKFRALGALIVDPNTAIVSLLDHFVRSPMATSLLLGTDDGQDVEDIVLRNPLYNGMALRDLRLPLDTLVLSVHRDGHTIISHGYTRLKVGDELTVLGSPESLAELNLLFED